MLPLVLFLLSAAPASEARKGPPASEMAKLYFLAGDLRRAIETARQGINSDPVKCKALYPMLVEYQFLVPRGDELTPAEARAFLEWDRKISPGTPGAGTGTTPAVRPSRSIPPCLSPASTCTRAKTSS